MKKTIFTIISFGMICSAATIAVSWTMGNELALGKSNSNINCFGKPEINWDTSPLTQSQIERSLEINFQYESDDPNKFYVYNGYLLKYSEENKSALWTTHQITYERVREKDDQNKKIGTALDRGKYCLEFKQDPNRSRIDRQAHHNDYIGTGFDKGHMTPAGDFRNDSIGMLETFFITNMSAQSPDFNQLVMKNMEDRIRNWVRRNKQNVQVITGALYQDKKGRGFGSSKNQVNYPSAHYKIMYTEMEGHHYLYCFLVPHQFAYGDYNLKDFQVSLDEIERASGEDFLDNIEDELENYIEAKIMEFDGF